MSSRATPQPRPLIMSPCPRQQIAFMLLFSPLVLRSPCGDAQIQHTLFVPLFFYTEKLRFLQREGVRAGRWRLHKWKPCQPRVTLDSTWWWHSGFVDMDVLLPSAVAMGWGTISSGWDSVQWRRLEKFRGWHFWPDRFIDDVHCTSVAGELRSMQSWGDGFLVLSA